MLSSLKTQFLTLSLVLPAVAFQAAAAPRKASFQPAEAAQVVARCDHGLDSMRAGRVDGPAPIGEDERAELRAMQAKSGELDHLRAGGGGSLVLILAVLLLVVLLI